MKNDIELKETQIKSVQTKLENSEVIVKDLENKNKNLEKDMEETLKENRKLSDKVEQIERINGNMEEVVRKIKKENNDLKETIDIKNEETDVLIRDNIKEANENREELMLQLKQYDLQENSKPQFTESIKLGKEEQVHWCYACEFVGKTKQELLTHIKSKHMKKFAQQ